MIEEEAVETRASVQIKMIDMLLQAGADVNATIPMYSYRNNSSVLGYAGTTTLSLFLSPSPSLTVLLLFGDISAYRSTP